MKEINFITIGDNNYFGFVNHSVKKTMLFYPNCKFYIYDWGFTDKQRKILSSYPITIIVNWTHNIFTIGLGINSDKLPNLVPHPPANIITFIYLIKKCFLNIRRIMLLINKIFH